MIGATYAGGNVFRPGGNPMSNTWAWTQNWFARVHSANEINACCIPKKPRGPASGTFDVNVPDIPIPQKVLKGGSLLCAPSYCQRYRPAAHHAEAIDSSTCRVGFRCGTRATG